MKLRDSSHGAIGLRSQYPSGYHEKEPLCPHRVDIVSLSSFPKYICFLSRTYKPGFSVLHRKRLHLENKANVQIVLRLLHSFLCGHGGSATVSGVPPGSFLRYPNGYCEWSPTTPCERPLTVLLLYLDLGNITA